MGERDLFSEIPEEKRDKVVPFREHLYATLDWEPPGSTRLGPLELPAPVPIPDGWELSADTPEIAEAVAGQHPWGTALLVMRTGAGFTTAGWKGQPGSKISNYELLSINDELFGPRRALPSRPSRVLIRYPAGIDTRLPKLLAGPPSFERLSALAKAAAPKKSLAAAGCGLLFPGQGAQYVGMLKEAAESLPAVREILSTAAGILGYDLLQVCLEGPEEKLEETRFCQPAIFVGGLAALEKLKAEKPGALEKAKSFAGLSLGEYTALCAAGVLPFKEALRLVQLRGEAMQEAAAVGKQAMLSVAGLEEDQLQSLCAEVLEKAEEGEVCSVANHLFPKGYSVGGTEKSVLLLKEAAENAGALQAKVLKTAGAFHTELMRPAQERLSQALEEALPKMKPPKQTVWMNASAEPMRPGADPRNIVELLKRQLTRPVLWEQCVKAMLEEGISEFYEVGPQKQLKAMMKRIDADAWKQTTNVTV